MTDEHDRHVRGEGPAHRAAQSVEQESGQGHIALAEFPDQEPHREDTDTHGNPADARQHGLGEAVVVGVKNVAAKVHQAHVLDCLHAGGEHHADAVHHQLRPQR